MPRGASSNATERENASCACFEAEYGPSADEAGDRDDVDDVRAGAETGQERQRCPHGSQVVDGDDLLDPVGLGGEIAAARGEARVVDEQIDVRVPLEHTGRDGLDCGAVCDVALLVLVRLRRRAREADHVRASLLQRAHELGTDAGGRAGDDCY